MEKETPRKYQQYRDQSVDSDQHWTDNIRDALKDIEVDNRRPELECFRGNEYEDGGSKGFQNSLKIDEEDYKGKLRAANVTIIQLKRRLQEVEEQKNEQLAASKKLMQEKFEVYETELEESNKTIKWLEDQVVKAKGEDGESLVDLKAKLFESEMEVSRKMNEILTLKSQLKESLEASEDASKLRDKLESTLAQCDEISAELQAKNLEHTEMKTKLTSLEQKLEETKQLTMDDLQEAFKRGTQQKVENLQAKNRISELEQELEMAQRNLDLKTKQMLAQESELTSVRRQLVQAQSALNEAVPARDNARAELAEANCQLKSLKLKEKELNALKAQVESFKSDFECERLSLQTEKDRNMQLYDELQQLRSNNESLQAEVDAMRRDMMYSTACPPPNCAPPGCYMPPPPLYHGYYKCPKCLNIFQNFGQSDIEYHVYNCMT